MSPISAKTYTTEVICLRTVQFGEADKILHLYSPEYGRISAIAKGVKKPGSKLAGACEILGVSEVQLAKGKSLDVLCQYQPRLNFVGIRSDLLKLAYGQLFGELVYATQTETDTDSQDVYARLKQGLTLLDGAEESEITPLALDYQLAFLEAAGFHPNLTECIFTGETLQLAGAGAAVYYCFSPDLGGVTSPERKKAHQQQTGSFGMPWVNISVSTLGVLAQPHHPQWQAGQLLKAQKFLQYYLKQVFEKKLHSYDLVFNLLEGAPSLPLPAGEPVNQPASVS